MCGAAQAALEKLGGIYAYTESDEISILLSSASELFSRRVEKLIALSASSAAVAFSISSGLRAAFDSRIIVLPKKENVTDYFLWRQEDAARCALNGCAYWMLRKKGWSVSRATRELEGKGSAFKHELLFAEGINFNNLPLWQRRGTGCYFENFEKKAMNPQSGKEVMAIRRRLIINEILPMKDEYRVLIEKILAT